MIDIKEIQKFLSHRYPMLMVDRILEIEPRKRVIGLKNLTIGEMFFQGHFPDEPIMPGVYIVEALAQTGGFLFMDEADSGQKKVNRYIAAINNVKFMKPVEPGDSLILETSLLVESGPLAKIKGEARVNGDVVAKAEITYAVMG